MNTNVNCKHCTGFGKCSKLPKTMGIFKKPCVEHGVLSISCMIAERFPRPAPPKAQPPARQPIRYKVEY